MSEPQMTVQQAKDILRTEYRHPQHKEAEALLIEEVERLGEKVECCQAGHEATLVVLNGERKTSEQLKSSLQKAQSACLELKGALSDSSLYLHLGPRLKECINRALSNDCGSALLARIVSLESSCKEVMQWHADRQSPEYNECDTEPCAWCTGVKKALSPTAENPLLEELKAWKLACLEASLVAGGDISSPANFRKQQVDAALSMIAELQRYRERFGSL